MKREKIEMIIIIIIKMSGLCGGDSTALRSIAESLRVMAEEQKTQTSLIRMIAANNLNKLGSYRESYLPFCRKLEESDRHYSHSQTPGKQAAPQITPGHSHPSCALPAHYPHGFPGRH